MPIEKLKYSKGEKLAEIASAVITAGAVAEQIVAFNSGRISGSMILMILVIITFYTAFTFYSVFPQRTDLAAKLEKCSENQLHSIRWYCITAKAILIGLIFAAVAVFII